MTNSPVLVSESCHESTFKLIRHHNFNEVFFSVGATWNGVHLSHSRQVAHVYYQLFDSKMADGDQLWSVPKLEYDLLRRNTSTNVRKTDLIERYILVWWEEFQDTEGVIRIRNSKKDRQQ
jgi:hypothetical protein